MWRLSLLTLACALVLPALGGCASHPVERVGIVTGRGKPLTLLGQTPPVGQPAPTFTVTANDMSEYRFDPKAGQVFILSSVPSLDTQVCSLETRRFNQEAAELGKDIHVLTISMDLPFAQKRWCGAEGVQRVTTLSDYRNHSFAQAYGVYIKENGLLGRAVFVVDRQGQIVYEQIVPELTEQPDYAAALSAARAAEQATP
ncbi:MAG: thiol peroxidase [Phycisphaerae bacterium]